MSADAVWYVSMHGRQVGPFKHSYVIAMLQSGQYDASAYVAAPHLHGWVPITSEPSLAPYAQPPVGMPVGAHPAPPAAWPGYPAASGASGAYPAGQAGQAGLAGQAGPRASKTMQGTKIAAYILLGIAGFFLALIPMMALDTEGDGSSAIYGAVMFALLCGIPGGILYWRVRANTFREKVIGYLESRNRIRVSEVAKVIGKTELDAEDLIAKLNRQETLNLVFDPQERVYVHRERISGDHEIAESCPTCGAPVETQLVLQGEKACCKYCGAIVSK